MLTQEQKIQFRKDLPRLASGKAGKRERIIKIRKALSEMSEDQRQALANKLGVVTVEGHPLTVYNQCFLVAQTPLNFTIVGGFQQWRKAGRIVRKGEHGFLILVPAKQRQNDSGIDNFIADDEDLKFYTATVFDISQTEQINQKEAA